MNKIRNATYPNTLGETQEYRQLLSEVKERVNAQYVANGSGGPQDYAQLLVEVKERVRSAQYAALKAVNTELVGLY